jgi:quercetin dioxygenase-like cupin family protein
VARSGDEITFEGFDDRLVFGATSDETGGELLRYEVWLRPRGVLTREHVHPHQEERHELVSGRLGMSVDGSLKTLAEGDVVSVAKGVPHALVPMDGGEVRLIVELRPALRWETLLETAVHLSRQKLRVWRGYVNPLLLAIIAREYEPEIHPTRPPLAVQRAVLGPLAAVGRRLGYERRYLNPPSVTPSPPAGEPG